MCASAVYQPRQYLRVLTKLGEVGVAVGVAMGVAVGLLVEPWETVLLQRGKKRHLSQGTVSMTDGPQPCAQEGSSALEWAEKTSH